MDTVLLFNENTTRPIASVTMKDIPSTTLQHIISSNQYLALPRLSSQVELHFNYTNPGVIKSNLFHLGYTGFFMSLRVE